MTIEGIFLMGNVLIYKGYHAQIKYDAENKVLLWKN